LIGVGKVSQGDDWLAWQERKRTELDRQHLHNLFLQNLCFLSLQIFDVTCSFHCCFVLKNIFFTFSLHLLYLSKKFSVIYTLLRSLVYLVDQFRQTTAASFSLREWLFNLYNYIFGCVRRLSCHRIPERDWLERLFSRNNSTDLLLTFGNCFI